MSVPPNIDRFNKATLLVFDRLYQAFPVPIDLDASAIAVDTLPPDAEYDETFAAFEPVHYTIQFLQNEGFIEYADKTVDGKDFLHVRLTSKSLALLGQVPSALTAQVSISDRIRSLVKGGVREVSSEAAKKAVELIFAHGTSLLAVGQAAAM